MHRRLQKQLGRRELKLNEKKTRIDVAALHPCGAAPSSQSVSLRSAVDFEKESFEFLGFRLMWRKGKSG